MIYIIRLQVRDQILEVKEIKHDEIYNQITGERSDVRSWRDKTWWDIKSLLKQYLKVFYVVISANSFTNNLLNHFMLSGSVSTAQLLWFML